MKSKKVKIIIKSRAQLKQELASALKGKRRRIQSDDEIVFSSVEALMKVLTKSRLEILIFLTKHKPNSIYELAKGLGKDFKNVHSDVRKLANLELIILENKNDARRSLRPGAKYTGIEWDLVA
jgi:predicted transcriptional regulator